MPGDPGLPPRLVPRERANRLIRAIAAWLAEPDADSIERQAQAWDEATRMDLRRVLSMHGMAASLAAHVGRTGELGAWLDEQRELNSRRIARLHDDLATILDAAAAAGVEVMPLKGAILTTRPGRDPAGRPMADLDLLIRPADRPAMHALLEGLGYRRELIVSRRPGPDSYIDRGDGAIASYEGEHPDNPRRVELHTEVKRHLWAWDDRDDLTPELWDGASRAEVLGRPATVPRPAALLAHLAIHASSDLLIGRGRLLHLQDLAELGAVAEPASLPHPRLAYPALRLAARVFPARLQALDLAPLEQRLPWRLVRWAASVPIDGRAGLITGPPPRDDRSWAARWARWRPMRWRLAVAYGAAPLPVALARHGLVLVRRARTSGQDEPGRTSLA